LYHDEKLYPQPFEFMHHRFTRPVDKTEETKGRVVGQAAAAETDGNFAAWGIGKHACPGRFFGVDVIKIILTHILVEYEVEHLKRAA
jgi:cytochrome P450